MKKVFHIMLSILLLISTAGLSVSRHLCGGTVHDMAILQQAVHCHGEDEMEMNDCCEDETSHYQVNDDFQQESSLEIAEVADHLFYIIPFLTFNHGQKDQNTTCAYDGSPPISGTDILKRVQSFLL